MATGKELVRMVSCGIWKNRIVTRGDYKGFTIYDTYGDVIDLKQAKESTFCHIVIRFYQCPKDSLQLIEKMLEMLASTRCEQMGSKTIEYYGGCQMIIIS